ncbi:MAG: YlbF family regulator [Ruminococcaceae bacterium]|nr:YlbF family regulator [Oscillospiraceae bacterium]
MDVIKMARELGKAIQADERYKNILVAIEKNEADTELKPLVDRVQAIQTKYQAGIDAGKTQEDLDPLDKEFQEVYAKIMQNENMKNYESAQKEMDSMMKNIVQILTLCANGADPNTCDPSKIPQK